LLIEYEGAIYHLMNRGDRREPIFHDETDRKQGAADFFQKCLNTGDDNNFEYMSMGIKSLSKIL
jgi:hypothetical protein